MVLCSGRGTRALLNDREYLGRLRIDPSKRLLERNVRDHLFLAAKPVIDAASGLSVT